MKGLIFDIKRYSIHDGPGIRTTVFLKGCPLKCLWCHNPESQNSKPQFFYYRDKCIGCKLCVSVCSTKGLTFRDNKIARNSCEYCLKCEEVCPSLSIKTVGKYYSIPDLVNIIKKDIDFYGSTGGVTFSGGEPLMQYDFLMEALKTLKEKNINIAIDTCGYTTSERILQVSEFADIFLYDLKHFDNHKHKELTGVGNDLILQNLKLLSKTGVKIIVRVPVIPTLTDSEDNLKSIRDFVESLRGDITLEPVFYHDIMTGKYELCEMEYALNHLTKPDEYYKKEKSSILGVSYDEAS
ncbi:glycyl-radical enzyme activating protein [Deferribacteraceae bacterium V6Fe1]|nr:glycyl-radical enzyme activating protein [Deferribacteraceae bacterium V6Fe1]